MTGIRWRRVLAGGALAGLLYNVGGLTVAALLDLETAFARFGWEPGPGAAALHVGLRLGYGLISVWLYAAIRPRFGPGPRTALVAGLAVWLTAYLPATLVMTEIGLFTPSQAGLGLLWALAEAGVATLAGAAVYREDAV